MHLHSDSSEIPCRHKSVELLLRVGPVKSIKMMNCIERWFLALAMPHREFIAENKIEAALLLSEASGRN